VAYVANREIPFPPSAYAEMVVCGDREGAADDLIVGHAVKGDLVVTRDIPLAAELVETGISVINDRGIEYSENNIRQRLSVRNFMAELRERGVKTPPESTFGRKEVRAFANAFDRIVTRLLKAPPERS
jgi:uncharacterized protein YaiI (UPF0178 family)